MAMNGNFGDNHRQGAVCFVSQELNQETRELMTQVHVRGCVKGFNGNEISVACIGKGGAL